MHVLAKNIGEGSEVQTLAQKASLVRPYLRCLCHWRLPLPHGIDFTKLHFGRKICGQIFILKFRKNYHPKTTIYKFIFV
jgi:hypothetical protein